MMQTIAKYWQLRTKRLVFGRVPQIMGILNVTPDSFSDGGKFHSTDRAVERALAMVAEGADILDIGGESTRPYSTPVGLDEELDRVLPVIERLVARTGVPISIDTSKPVVAREAVRLGAEIINDVTGFRDPEMVKVAGECQAGLCVMHMQGTPQTMQDNPTYANVVEDIYDYLMHRVDELVQTGIVRDKICLDPGVGFGKTHQHNLELIARSDRFLQAGLPILVGYSRKGFIGKVLRDPNRDRLGGTVGIALRLAQLRVQLIRVHDVAPVKDALALFDSVGGIDGNILRLS